ncbi:GTPase-activating protein SED4 SKDI_03G1270 [Saccharomyces kudriavzevii IFO 1802]|uniref:Uncharacterized protein n=2 Tax=Saccharomyces kudriavzevii (strain ATCC MYA-4449 / AS 2.2408 / CBS 8840 / NBRC 1802 / NCYC 2889) TaxID=226230 RepID=A0AA35JF04_SACK1|nr:uncharacterized protein SKDI_03G1270 [Saccharomyces kudriavzevii IFO 1802]EJT43527.1 SED4-like protein [Saccharomyces kudriavzevii IFO 1802]CAI4056795.1 hypothetical protein SKDI_03G1270 [Saccharomyces kudriavzevii IFO 1802]
MMSGDSANYNVGYPIYGAKFINEDTLLVAGGGGQYNPSFSNKITALKVNFQKKKHIRRFREITLDSIDDAPTSLDCNNNLILVGCNELFNEPSLANVNHHLRKFVFEREHLKFVASIDFNRTTEPSVFSKFIYINQMATVAAIASSEVPTVIRIIDPRNLTENYEIETGKEVNDLHFAPNGILLSYVTSNSLEVASVRDGKFVARKIDFDKNLILSNIRFLNDNTILVAASLLNSDGVSLLKLGVSSKGVKILKTASFMFDLNGITSMDVSPNKEFVALSSKDKSIAIISVQKLKLVQLVPRVHESTITRVTFSPDSKYLASTSIGNTINVLKLSSKSSSFLRKVWKFFVNFILLVFLAGAIQLGYKYNAHGLIYRYARDMYKSKFEQSSPLDPETSHYFTINDGTKDITITADIVSVTHLTSDIDTELSSFDTSTMKTVVGDEESSVWVSSSIISSSPSLSSFSKASESVAKELPISSSSFVHESAANEPILSSSTSEVTKSISSSSESIISETSVTPSKAESTSLSLATSTESPQSAISLSEQTSSTVVEQSENQATKLRDNESRAVSSVSSSSSIIIATVTSPSSTSARTAVTTTNADSINDSGKLTSMDNSKFASTREIYRTKVITEVITKIEYRNIPASSSETTTRQYGSTISSRSPTPTNTIVSGPVTKIDPIASELEGMAETPVDPTSVRSEIEPVKSSLTPTTSLIPASESFTSSFQSPEVPTATSSAFVFEPTPLSPVLTVSNNHSVSESISSVIEEATASSSLETGTEAATTTKNSGYTSDVAEMIQSLGTDSVLPSASKTTNIGDIPSPSAALSSVSVNSIIVQSFDKTTSLPVKADPTIVSHMTAYTSLALSSLRDSHGTAANSAASPEFVQKEIVIEVKPTKSLPGTTDTFDNLLSASIKKEDTFTETHTSNYEEVTDSASSYGEVASSFNVQTSTFADVKIPSEPTTKPLGSNPDSDIVHGGNEAVDTINDVDLHDEL